jgi:glycosyltransferase involved in cell wall biosynthesis
MKLSIVTASFNSAQTISDTLRTVDAQQGKRGVQLEHLVIDGASTDSTLSIVEKYSQQWRRVQSEPDRGLYDAMNKGLLGACGDVVGLLNSDDLYPHDEVLSTVAEAFEADPSLDAVYGDLCYVKQDNTSEVVRYWRSSDYSPGLFQRGWVPPHPTFFARRSVYQRHGGFDLRYRLAADWELLARFIEVHRIRTRYLPTVLVHMRLGGATNRSLSNVWKQNREIWRAAHANGLRPSIGGFVAGKLWSRSQQFLTRAR